MSQMWNFKLRQYAGPVRSEPLALGWEVNYDPISDNFTPDEASAEELLEMWVQGIRKDGPFVPIYWTVEPVSETAPFQIKKWIHEDFLTFFTWPENAAGEPLQWARLPVEDKLWHPAKGRRKERADKGGFIQEATGWKPAPLQEKLHWPTLLAASGFGHLIEKETDN